jgi:hypothetical protein
MQQKNLDLKKQREELRDAVCQIFLRIGQDIDNVYADPHYKTTQEQLLNKKVTVIGSMGAHVTSYSNLDPQRPNLRDIYAASLCVSSDKAQILKYSDDIIMYWSGNSLVNMDDIYNSHHQDLLADLTDALSKAAQYAEDIKRKQEGKTVSSPFASASPHRNTLIVAETLLRQMQKALVRHSSCKPREDNNLSPWKN